MTPELSGAIATLVNVITAGVVILIFAFIWRNM
jgi:hypothetical protein